MSLVATLAIISAISGLGLSSALLALLQAHLSRRLAAATALNIKAETESLYQQMAKECREELAGILKQLAECRSTSLVQAVTIAAMQARLDALERRQNGG